MGYYIEINTEYCIKVYYFKNEMIKENVLGTLLVIISV